MKFITTDHVQLHYTDTGDSGKPVIVGIPGIGGSSQLWLNAISLFKDDFRFIMLDPRNQGQSERTYKGQRMSRHAADLEELLAKLNLHQVIGIGNSMGASNIWAYLAQYGKGRLAAMVDLDQSPKMIADDTWKYGFNDLTWSNYPDYLKLPFGRASHAHIADDMFQAAKHERQLFPYDPEENYKCLVDHAEQDWRDILLEKPVPMLVLAGENSPFFDHHFVQAVKEINSHIETKVIPNCGHLIQAEQPLAMHDAVMDFLQEQKII